jgi:hypothetical protein
MKRAALAAAILVAGSIRATAQTTPTIYTFSTVDEVQTYAYILKVTGILQGEASATTLTFNFPNYTSASAADQLASCERKALLAMAKPGQYLLKLDYYGSTPRCALTRANP